MGPPDPAVRVDPRRIGDTVRACLGVRTAPCDIVEILVADLSTEVVRHKLEVVQEELRFVGVDVLAHEYWDPARLQKMAHPLVSPLPPRLSPRSLEGRSQRMSL